MQHITQRAVAYLRVCQSDRLPYASVFSVYTLRCELSRAHAHVAEVKSSVQHVGYITSVAFHIVQRVCHMVRQHRTAVNFDKAEIAFMISFIFSLPGTIN